MDIQTAASALGVGQYFIYVVIGAYIVAHLIASGLIPAPAAGSTGVYAKVFGVLNKLAANYGSAANLQQALDAGTHVTAAVVKVAAMLALCLALGLSACKSATVASNTAAVNVTLTTAQVDAQKAINLYDISKGLAQIAELAAPELVPAITAGFAVADPLVAKAQVALTDASADAGALEALVTQITAQANALTVQSAGVIKVVPAS